MTDFHGFIFGGCRSSQKPAANGKVGICDLFVGGFLGGAQLIGGKANKIAQK
jgi:hypothetical protein